MRHFDEIFDIAAKRKGGTDALEALLSTPKSATDLAAIPDDRWLSQLTKSIFQAGFNWKVVEHKWQGFEDAFHGFDLGHCAFMDEDDFDQLLSNTDVVRNGMKLATVRENASFLMKMHEQGGAGAVLGSWPSEDYIGLLDLLHKNGSRLGAATGQYSMRFMGRDSFVLSRDVTARLVAEGVIDKAATSKRARRAVQDAFNLWMEQSNRPLTQISQTLAMSL